PGPEDLEHQLVERDRGMGAEERHRVPRAVGLELLAPALVLALVGLEQRARDRDLAGIAGLAVDERQITVELRIGLALIVDLKDERLELVVAQRVESILEAGGVVEVGDQDRQAAPLVLGDERLHALGELGLAADVAMPEEVEHAEDPVLAARRRQ